MSQRGVLRWTMEFIDGLEGNVDSVELLVHYTFRPGRPARTYGDPDDCYPAEAHEAEFDYAELISEPDGARVVEQRLMTGEWLEGACVKWFESRTEDELIAGLPGPYEDF